MNGTPALSLQRVDAARLATGALVTVVIAIAGLYIVKWSPYYAKTFAAAAHHSLGVSILTGKATAAPAVGWQAAWDYARAYYLAIWQALVLSLLLGACVQVLVPRAWIAQRLGRLGFGSTVVVGALSAAGMMCTCCTAPIVVGLRKQRASAGAAMAMFVATPTLNPAVLLFIGFVLSWQLAGLRLVAGLAIVVAVAWLANALTPRAERNAAAGDIVASPIEDPSLGPGEVVRAWLAALWWEIRTILPGYIVVVLLLGAARAWLFPAGLLLHGGGLVTTLIAAIAGTLFVIPTGAEVPIVQSLSAAGLGIAPAVALLVALPAISLPSMFIARSGFRPVVFAAVGGAVALGAILAGVVAAALHLTA
jgi:uncharacterized membrane protein YraQ (UPF0718 family)